MTASTRLHPKRHEPKMTPAASGVIAPSNGRKTILGAWLAVLVWNAIAIPATILFFRDVRPRIGLWTALIVLFPTCGLLMLIGAFYQTLRFLRFGRSELTLAPFPAHPGEPLNASVRVNASLQDVSEIIAELQCVRRTVDRDREGRSFTETVLHEDDQRPTIVGNFVDPTLCVSFTPPTDAPPAVGTADDDDQIVWRLVVRGKRIGIDYQVKFELPVLARGVDDLSPFAVPFPAAASAAAETGLPIGALARQRIVVRALPGGAISVDFPAARRIALTSILTVVALLFDAIAFYAARPGGFFGKFARPNEGLLDIAVGVFESFHRAVFVLGFGGIGLALTACVLSMWLVRVTATADRSGLTVTRRLLGLKTQRRLTADALVAIAPHRTASSGEHVYYSLRATTSSHRTHSFGSGIEGFPLAERLAEAMLSATTS